LQLLTKPTFVSRWNKQDFSLQKKITLWEPRRIPKNGVSVPVGGARINVERGPQKTTPLLNSITVIESLNSTVAKSEEQSTDAGRQAGRQAEG